MYVHYPAKQAYFCFGKNYRPTSWIARLTEAWGESRNSVRGGQRYEMVVGPRPNPLAAVCFQNGGPLRTLDLGQASASRKTPALQAICPLGTNWFLTHTFLRLTLNDFTLTLDNFTR